MPTAGSVPNAVNDEMFAQLREHWNDGQIVAMISLFGFLNRWNDIFATPLEDEALAIGLKAPRAAWLGGRQTSEERLNNVMDALLNKLLNNPASTQGGYKLGGCSKAA